MFNAHSVAKLKLEKFKCLLFTAHPFIPFHRFTWTPGYLVSVLFCVKGVWTGRRHVSLLKGGGADALVSGCFYQLWAATAAACKM